MAATGYPVWPEAGRQIVKEQQSIGATDVQNGTFSLTFYYPFNPCVAIPSIIYRCKKR
jgi:hypothetical protein